MSNGERSSGDLVVNVFSGRGPLLGIVVGLSKSPVVAIVVGALTSLLAGGIAPSTARMRGPAKI